MRNYFFCYNKKLSDFLTNTKGIKFITIAKEPKSGKLFSLYHIDSTLQSAIDEYKQSK